MRTCEKCKTEYSKKSKSCPKCGEPNKEAKKKKWIIIGVVVFILLAIIIMSSSGESDTKSNSKSNSGSKNSLVTTTKSTRTVYGYNEPFIFDNLEITINEDYIFDTIKNRYSDNNGKTVVGLSITVKNLSNETHGLNMFYYDIYGTEGTEVDTMNAYFDDTLDYSGDLRPDA